MLMEAAKDAGCFGQELKAPPKPSTAANLDYNDPYTMHLLEWFDQGAKVIVHPKQPSPICSSGDPADRFKAITHDDLVDELTLIAAPKEGYKDEILQYLPKGKKQALDAEMEKEDSACSVELKRYTSEAAKKLVKAAFNPKDATYSQLHLNKASPGLKFFEDFYLCSNEFCGRGMKMAERIGLSGASDAVLMLMGTDGAVAQFHIDRTKAGNTAFAIDLDGKGVDLNETLATWIFIHPAGIQKAEECLRDMFPDFTIFKHSGDKMPVVRELEEITKLREYCGFLPSGAPVVTVVEQKHGCLVAFPPGYMHQVITHRPSKVRCRWPLDQSPLGFKEVGIRLYGDPFFYF